MRKYDWLQVFGKNFYEIYTNFFLHHKEYCSRFSLYLVIVVWGPVMWRFSWCLRIICICGVIRLSIKVELITKKKKKFPTTFPITMSSLNAQYLAYLIKYPLLTKSITSGVFSGLNETVASVLTNEFQETKVAGIKIKHVFTQKLLTMIIYGSCIATPISHYMYFIINNKIFKGPLTKSGKILQILTSLSTVTPTLAACFVSWIALINNYKLPKGSINPIAELNKIVAIVRAGLKKGYFGVLKSSLVTSSVALVIAQKFVPPELWVVFFNVVYFFLGTYQNTKLKRLQKQQRLAK